MKNLGTYLIIFFIYGISNIGFGQEVMESAKVMSKGLHSSASIELNDVDERSVETWWREFLKENDVRKIKRDRKSKELAAEEATIDAINGVTPVNLYTKIESAGKYTALTIWVESGEAYISSEGNPEEFSGMEALLQDFSHFVDTEKVKIKLDNEEDTLKDLERDLEKLQRDKEKFENEIEKAEETIRKAEDNILKNEEEQKAAQVKIEEQMKAVEQVRIELDDMKKNKTKN